MNIGILTIAPLNNNYGGVLQCYALMSHLKSHGHNVRLIARVNNELSFLQKLKFQVKVMLGKAPNSDKEFEAITAKFRYFENTYLQPQTQLFNSELSLQKINNYDFDAVIVGSDQVWRKGYSDERKANFFLDFVTNNKTKKIAYAASFGVDFWGYSPQETIRYSKLIKKFDGISVREDSGQKLCEEHLGVQATHVLDPTLLVNKDVYLKLTKLENEEESNGELLYYIINEHPNVRQLVEEVSKALNFTSFSVTRQTGNLSSQLSERTYPSVTKWLKGFEDAQFVVTDSFHGFLFSLIFNKPFLIYANKKTGIARYESLLKILSLEDRIVYELSDFKPEILHKKIDWEVVNKTLELKRKESNDFLDFHLKK